MTSFVLLLSGLVALSPVQDPEALWAAKDWERLRSLATALVQATPRDPAPWRWLGLSAAGRGDREETLRCARSLASLRPREAVALLKDPLVLPLLYDPTLLGTLRPGQVRVKSRPPLPLAPALHHEEGARVPLEVIVDGDGSLLGVRALEGSPAMRSAAESYVVQWAMDPTPDGRPARFFLGLRFRMPGGRQRFDPDEFDPMGGVGRHDHARYPPMAW